MDDGSVSGLISSDQPVNNRDTDSTSLPAELRVGLRKTDSGSSVDLTSSSNDDHRRLQSSSVSNKQADTSVNYLILMIFHRLLYIPGSEKGIWEIFFAVSSVIMLQSKQRNIQ